MHAHGFKVHILFGHDYTVTLQKKLINLTIFLMVKTIETEVTFINVALTKYKKRQFNFYVIIITTI